MQQSENIGDLALALSKAQGMLEGANKTSDNPHEDKKYYVYAHYDCFCDVFYVGKGSGDRLYATGNRGSYWKKIKNKHGVCPIKLEENLTEEGSFDREIFWIKHFKSIGQCRANFTDGGDGVRVKKRWWNKKISTALTGIVRPFGEDNKSFKKFTTEKELRRLYVEEGMNATDIGEMFNVSYTTVLTRVEQYGLKKNNCGRAKIPVICVDDGIVFTSLSDAAKHYGVFRENIRKVLNGNYKTTGGKSFRYVANNR